MEKEGVGYLLMGLALKNRFLMVFSCLYQYPQVREYIVFAELEERISFTVPSA